MAIDLLVVAIHYILQFMSSCHLAHTEGHVGRRSTILSLSCVVCDPLPAAVATSY